MTDFDFNPVVWISLASTSGLSLISLGQPGLRSDLDEQVYTGGLTAVQQMLAGEVGGDTKRFIGGSHNNKTGRFLVKGEDEKELVGQFLLISSKGETVAPDLINYYEQLVTMFAQETLSTDHFKRAEDYYVSFGVHDILREFFLSIKKARKKVSIPLNGDLFTNALKSALDNSINDYEYSPTLVKISELNGKYEDLHNQIESKREELLQEFNTDMLEFLTSEHPHALVMFPKTDSLRKELKKQLISHVKNLTVESALREIIQDFEQNDLTKVLEDFSLHEVTRANLYIRLEDEILQKFLREFPLLYLADPKISGFQEAITNLNNRISEMYDLGGTLSRIAKEMLQGHQKEETLIIPFIRHFCEQFPTGLTTVAWKYMQILFKFITVETKVDVTDVLPKFKDDIPPSHFMNIEKMITKYKLTKISPTSFSVKRATDVLPFYRALLFVLGYGASTLISEMSFKESTPDNLISHTIERFEVFSTELAKICFLFAVYSYLEREKSKFDFTLGYPDIDMIDGEFDIAKLNSESLTALLIKSNLEYMKKEQKTIEKGLEELRKEHKKRLEDIEKFLSQKPKNIAKGYSFNLKEVNKISFSKKPAPDIQSILKNLQNDYYKIFEQIESELIKVKEISKEFLGKKISEKKFNNIIMNKSFLTQNQGDFNKLVQKTEESIRKKYEKLSTKIEKPIQKRSRNFSKKFSSSFNFLNINQKAFSKDEKPFFPDCSNIISSIQPALNNVFKKEDLVEIETLGLYNFYSRIQMLPTVIENDVLNSLVQKKSYPLLKEAKGSLKSSETKDVFKSYSKILEQHTNELIKRIYIEIGENLGKDFYRSDPEIHFILRGQIAYPAIKLGSLLNLDAVKSLKSLLGPYIDFESQNINGKTVSQVFAVIHNFNCDYNELNTIWAKKEWRLRKVLLLLSWRSFLTRNSFYMNILQFSTDLYSARVKDSFNEMLNQIGKYLIAF